MKHDLLRKIEESISDSSSRFDLMAALINHFKVKKFAEIGVWKGEFAEHILKNCPSIELYYMIDPWEHLSDWNKPCNVSTEDFSSTYSEAMERTEFASDKRVVLRMTTKEALAKLKPDELDAVYIDGDHTLRGISIDLISIYNKITPHGYILGDDFSPTIWQHSTEFEPTGVFPFAVHFAEAKDDLICGLPFIQFLISKSVEPNEFEFIDFTGHYQDTGMLKQLSGKSLADELTNIITVKDSFIKDQEKVIALKDKYIYDLLESKK